MDLHIVQRGGRVAVAGFAGRGIVAVGPRVEQGRPCRVRDLGRTGFEVGVEVGEADGFGLGGRGGLGGRCVGEVRGERGVVG